MSTGSTGSTGTSPTNITQSLIGTTGYKISSSGNYALTQAITFIPPASVTPTHVTISGGGGSGTILFPLVVGGIVKKIFVSVGGQNFTSIPTITITGAGTGATATATLLGKRIGEITVTSGGSGYENTVRGAIVIDAPNVNLDLSNFTHTQGGSPKVDHTNFIVILPGPNNTAYSGITITGTGAIINGFTAAGIKSLGANAYTKINGVVTRNYTLSGITITNCPLQF